jgi:hypothetical protein
MPLVLAAQGCVLQGFFDNQIDTFDACGEAAQVCDPDGGHGVAVDTQDACNQITQAIAGACGAQAIIVDAGEVLISRPGGGLTVWECSNQREVPCSIDPSPDAPGSSICADSFAACLQRFRTATTCDAALATTCGDAVCVRGCEDGPANL